MARIIAGLLLGVVFGNRAYAGTPPLHEAAVVPVDDGFEAHPSWSGFCDDCEDFFRPVSSDAHAGSRSFFAPDSAVTSSVSADGGTVLIPQNASAAELTFWQRFEFEHDDPYNYDGGVLEVSAGGADAPWVDAAPHITGGGYNGTLVPGGNPLRGRAAWVGDSAGWQQVTVDLTAYRGQLLTFRLKMGTDGSNNSPVGGWWVDEFRVTYRAPLSACSHEWTRLSSLPAGVFGAVVARVGTDLYAFGGGIDRDFTSAAWRYATESDSWNPIAALPEARFGGSAVSDGRYIYLLGGYPTSNSLPTATVWRYDPTANSYLTVAPFNTATAHHAAVYLNGTIYKIAGRVSADNALNEQGTSLVEAYSVANNTWSSVAEYPKALGGVTAITADGYLYTAGGSQYPSPYADTFRYDVGSNTWDTGPIADVPEPAGDAHGTFYNGTWIVSSDNLLLGWDPRVNIWRSLDQAPQRIEQAAFSVVGSATYVLASEIPQGSETPLLQYLESSCACPGDCDGDGAVSVAELIKGVGIALHTRPFSECTAFDGNGDGNVAVNELVTAVSNALSGCSP